MNRKFKLRALASLFVPVVGIGMAVPAYADDTKKTGARAESRQVKQTMRDMRASKLIGSDVRNAQGENLGEIKDLVVDVNNERVYYAVLSFGGFLGLGDKLFAYPVRAFTQAADSDKVILNVDKAKLKAAPGFEKDRYPDFADRRYGDEVDRYFGKTIAVQPMPNQLLRRASELIGKDVNDRNGKDVGEIEDLVVNMANGKIHYAVVEFDKAWNLNDRLLAVPMKAFNYSRDRNDLVWDIDKSRVDAKLTFDKNRWPDLNDPKYLVDVDRYLVVFVPAGATTGAARTAGATGSAGMGTAGTASTGTPSTAGATTTNRAAATTDVDAVFILLDVNKDNTLSTSEAQKDGKVQGMWKQLDRDGDGKVTRDEFKAYRSAK